MILELVCNAKNDPQIQKHLRFYPNSSIVASKNSLHYLNGPQQNGHAYQLIEVANSIWLSKTLQLANSGCAPVDLITQLVTLGVAERDAETVINSLIQERILICEMEVGVTSGDPLKVFKDCLKSAPQAAPVLAKLKQTEQMSRADAPYDNAWAESFWTGPPGGRLKSELNMPKGGYESLEKLKAALFEYINGCYITRRLHSSLNYLNPASFEAEYLIFF